MVLIIRTKWGTLLVAAIKTALYPIFNDLVNGHKRNGNQIKDKI